MKRIILLVGLLMLMLIASAAAAAQDAPVVLNLGKWYQEHPLSAVPGATGEQVFKSPRSAVFVRQAAQGTTLAPHYHSNVDEIVYVVEGTAELLTNGNWVNLQPGDVHINPRGAVHALKVTNAKGVKFVSVFTPPQPAVGDMLFIPEGASLVSPAGVVDATPGVGVVVSLKEWQKAPVGGPPLDTPNMPDTMENDGLKSITIMDTPRSVVMLREAGYGASHSHRQDMADEIMLVVSGSARVNTGDSTNVLGRNYLHIAPMGTEHNMRLMLGENIRFITVFATPEKMPGRQPFKLQ